MHWAARLAHRVPASGKIQEDAQEHPDQHDGHPGGGHKETGRRVEEVEESASLIHFGKVSQDFLCNGRQVLYLSYPAYLFDLSAEFPPFTHNALFFAYVPHLNGTFRWLLNDQTDPRSTTAFLPILHRW